MQEKDWFAVRSIFRLDKPPDGSPTRMFEERVVLFRADNFQDALAKGEAEAKRHAEAWPQPKMLDHLVVFSIQENELREGEEVWSCLRRADVSDDQFLDRVYAWEMLGLRHLERGE